MCALAQALNYNYNPPEMVGAVLALGIIISRAGSDAAY